MAISEFFLGKITYKDNIPQMGKAPVEVDVALSSIGGKCRVYFDEEGPSGIRFELPKGQYSLFLVANESTQLISELQSVSINEPLSVRVSVSLIQRVELTIKNQNGIEARIPLW